MFSFHRASDESIYNCMTTAFISNMYGGGGNGNGIGTIISICAASSFHLH